MLDYVKSSSNGYVDIILRRFILTRNHGSHVHLIKDYMNMLIFTDFDFISH